MDQMASRFWTKVRKSDGCWEWTAGRSGKGYGQFYTGSALRDGAHRVAWELTHGPVPPSMVVMHLCDNPPCVRPSHLALGGQSANITDAFRKGRITRYNLAKTHCPQGHPYDEANTYCYRGRRHCRACQAERRVAFAESRRIPRDRTRCKRGHAYSPENTWIERREGREIRHCRICKNGAWLAWARRTGRISS